MTGLQAWAQGQVERTGHLSLMAVRKVIWRFEHAYVARFEFLPGILRVHKHFYHPDYIDIRIDTRKVIA